MKRYNFYKQNKQEPVGYDSVLKATSLIYLEEALNKEEYERCAELIKRAKDFGATGTEVRSILTGYIRGVKRNEAKKGKASPRF